VSRTALTALLLATVVGTLAPAGATVIDNQGPQRPYGFKRGETRPLWGLYVPKTKEALVRWLHDRWRSDDERARAVLRLSVRVDEIEFVELVVPKYADAGRHLRKSILSALMNGYRESKTGHALRAVIQLLALEKNDEVVRSVLNRYMVSHPDRPTVVSLNEFFRRWLSEGDRLRDLAPAQRAYGRAILAAR